MHKAQVLRDFLPTKITLWTNASLLDTFCRNIWHAKQGKVLREGSKFCRNKEMAVRALVARHVAWHGRRDWLRPSKYSRHVRSGTSPFAGFLKWRPEPRAGGSRPRPAPRFPRGGFCFCFCFPVNLADLSRNRFLTTCFSGSISQFGIH